MTRKRSFAMILAAGAALLVPVTSFAASPAAPAWDVNSLGPVDADPCVAAYGLAKCERSGGMAVENSEGLLVYVDDGRAKYLRTNSAGDTWTSPLTINPGSYDTAPSLAHAGTDVAVAYFSDAGDQVQFRRTFDFGDAWTSAKGMSAPRQLQTETAIAIGAVTALVASGYDEVPQGRPTAAVRVKVFPAAGPAHTTTFGFSGTGCGVMGTDPSVAVTGNGTVVLAYWQTCTKLVVRRSTDDGVSWSGPATLSTATHTLGTAIAAKGKKVVIAFTAGGKTLVRTSGNHGSSWGSPVNAGSGATSLRLVNQDGAWHLLSAGTTNVKYRSSTTGKVWTASTVASEPGTRTYAIGVAYDGRPMAAYVIRGTDKVYDAYEANDQ